MPTNLLLPFVIGALHRMGYLNWCAHTELQPAGSAQPQSWCSVQVQD